MALEQRSGGPAPKKEAEDEAAAEKTDDKNAAEWNFLIGKSPEAEEKSDQELQKCHARDDLEAMGVEKAI